jgi:hypothetical protein
MKNRRHLRVVPILVDSVDSPPGGRTVDASDVEAHPELLTVLAAAMSVVLEAYEIDPHEQRELATALRREATLAMMAVYVPRVPATRLLATADGATEKAEAARTSLLASCYELAVNAAASAAHRAVSREGE